MGQALSTQQLKSFKTQYEINFSKKILVDYFAGGGGASTGLEMGLNQPVSIAKNHSANALSMHEANHPHARHLTSDVYEGHPLEETRKQHVGWFHLSPDCTDHSQAKGGQPRSKEIRSLAWVGVRWAGQVRPDVISLENVKQILNWGPLVAKRDKKTGRVVTLEMIKDPRTGKLSNRIAEPGERVPVQNQFLVPDVKRKGRTWRRFVAVLRGMGYIVDWKIISAADFGAPTTRIRLYMLARCDGRQIVWPEPTHVSVKGKPIPKGMLPQRTTAECIDWDTPSKSIFGRKKPLVEATMRRLARGIKRFVIDAAEPFIVPVTHTGGDRVHPSSEPLRTITTAQRGEFMVASPILAGVGGRAGQTEPRAGDDLFYTITGKADTAVVVPYLVPRYGEREGQDPRTLPADEPHPTIVPDGNGGQLATAMLVAAGHGEGKPGGVQRWGTGAHDVEAPIGAIHGQGGSFALSSATLVKFRFDSDGQPIDQPCPAITSGGASKRPAGAAHALGVMTAHMTAFGQNAKGFKITGPMQTVMPGATRYGLVTAFMAQFNNHRGTEPSHGHDVRKPTSTITSTPQQGVVTANLVHLRNNCDARDVEDPLHTISAGGTHHALATAFLSRHFGQSVGQGADEPAPAIMSTGAGKTALVECKLSEEDEAGALRVAAFLLKYYSEGGQWGELDQPIDTITTKDRLALVTVYIRGTPYVIVDIHLRMLTPRELFRCQGFPDSYEIETGHDGRKFTKSQQVHMCGNSVSPPPMAAIARANNPWVDEQLAVAA